MAGLIPDSIPAGTHCCGTCEHFELNTATLEWSRNGYGSVSGACRHPALVALPYAVQKRTKVYRYDGAACAAWQPEGNQAEGG